jgi:hypothetical protein
MRRILSSVLAFHWMAVFALMAAVCAIDVDGGIGSALDLLGVTGTDPYRLHAGPGVSGLLAMGFAVVSVLFCWACVTVFFGDPADPAGDEVMRIAFGAATIALSLTLLGGALLEIGGLLPIIASHIAALLASYAAIHAERWAAASAEPEEGADIRAAARVMALGAVHSSLLSRLTGRRMAGKAR